MLSVMVIPRAQSDRGNPHLKKEIATPVCALVRNDIEKSEEMLCTKSYSSATGRFKPGTAYRAIQCYTTLCNGFTTFVLLAYYFS